jgi:hypothetical protein
MSVLSLLLNHKQNSDARKFAEEQARKARTVNVLLSIAGDGNRSEDEHAAAYEQLNTLLSDGKPQKSKGPRNPLQLLLGAVLHHDHANSNKRGAPEDIGQGGPLGSTVEAMRRRNDEMQTDTPGYVNVGTTTGTPAQQGATITIPASSVDMPSSVPTREGSTVPRKMERVDMPAMEVPLPDVPANPPQSFGFFTEGAPLPGTRRGSMTLADIQEARQRGTLEYELGLKAKYDAENDARTKDTRLAIVGLQLKGKELALAQSAISKEIRNRLENPEPFNPTDAYDSDLLTRAGAVGINFDTGMFGDHKNPATMEVLDPADASHIRKIRLQYNRETKLWNPVTLNGAPVVSNRVQPVDDSGRTPHQETTEAQSAARIEISRGHLDLARLSLDNRLSEQTRREFKDANRLSSDAERYGQAAADLANKTTYKDPETGEVRESKKWAAKRDEYEARAAALRREFIADYGYMFQSEDGDIKMSLDQFRQLFPSLQGNFTGEAERLGVTITDEGSMQGPVPVSTIPRRPAPARVASASKARYVSREKFRKKYPEFGDAPDAEVDAKIRESGYESKP